jgi:hypothetical protein
VWQKRFDQKGRRTGPLTTQPRPCPSTATVGKCCGRKTLATLADRLMAIDVVGRPLVTGHQITDATHRRRSTSLTVCTGPGRGRRIKGLASAGEASLVNCNFCFQVVGASLSLRRRLFWLSGPAAMLVLDERKNWSGRRTIKWPLVCEMRHYATVSCINAAVHQRLLQLLLLEHWNTPETHGGNVNRKAVCVHGGGWKNVPFVGPRSQDDWALGCQSPSSIGRAGVVLFIKRCI